MTDYAKLKNVFEMAEVLSAEHPHSLTVECFNEAENTVLSISFSFNDDQELIGVCTTE